MISYRATLDAPSETAVCVSRWLAGYRQIHDRRPWQRAATPYAQAVLVLRWFRERTDVDVPARDTNISIATAYRHLHEAIDVIAAHVPDLHDVLAKGLEQDREFVCLDGTLIPTVRSARRSEAGHDIWYSGKYHALLKRTWKTVERITLDPSRLTAIISAALALLHLQHPIRNT